MFLTYHLRIFFTLLLTAGATIVYGQKAKSPRFDIADFSKKAEIAEWLNRYDMVAWWTSDSVMAQPKDQLARLGEEWFCYQDPARTWHAVYGKYEANTFDLVFHYVVDSTAKVRRSFSPVDTAILHSYSRALITANKPLAALKDTARIRFNQYIRRNPDNTFTVWVLPAFQPAGLAVYGGDFGCTVSPSGSTILAEERYFQGNFRGFKTDNPREIWLNYRDIEKPTVGGIFFVLYYRRYFTRITIDTKISESFLLATENGSSYSWVHLDKDTKDKKKKKK